MINNRTHKLVAAKRYLIMAERFHAHAIAFEHCFLVLTAETSCFRPFLFNELKGFMQ